MPGHVAVCCKLPNGLTIRHPIDPTKTVTLNGANKATIIGAGYGTTMVEADFWDQWEAANVEFAPVVSGAIFKGKNANEVNAIAKEFKDRRTGFEGMSPTAFGVKDAKGKDADTELDAED